MARTCLWGRMEHWMTSLEIAINRRHLGYETLIPNDSTLRLLIKLAMTTFSSSDDDIFRLIVVTIETEMFNIKKYHIIFKLILLN